MDVAVDLRTGSPPFGRWEAVRLDDQSRRSVFLAEGLGHAFMALSESHSMHCQRRAGGRPGPPPADQPPPARTPLAPSTALFRASVGEERLSSTATSDCPTCSETCG